MFFVTAANLSIISEKTKKKAEIFRMCGKSLKSLVVSYFLCAFALRVHWRDKPNYTAAVEEVKVKYG